MERPTPNRGSAITLRQGELATQILGRSAPGTIYWLIIMALLCSNGIWYAWARRK
jgi:hypothetical protein